MVTVLPGGKSVVPEISGVSSLVSPCAPTVSAGASVSTTPSLSLAVAVFPASSVALTVTE